MIRVRARLRAAVHGPMEPDPPTAALGALVRAVRLESMLHLALPAGEVLDRLDRIAAEQEPAIRQVVAAVAAAVPYRATSVTNR